MPSNAILIALHGNDATQETDPDLFALYADQVTDYILIKEKARGIASVSGAFGSSELTIAHGLGYVPFCLAFIEISAGRWRKLFSSDIGGGSYFYVNGTNLVLHNGTGSTKNMSYYIFYDNVDSGGTVTIPASNENIIALAKIGRNVFSSNPNDFILNSLVNTFKIVVEATKSITLAASTNGQVFSQAHGLGFIPLVDAFAKRTAGSAAFKPNCIDIELWGAKLGMTGDVKFNYVEADITNIYFSFDNAKGSTVAVDIRYFCLEAIGA